MLFSACVKCFALLKIQLKAYQFQLITTLISYIMHAMFLCAVHAFVYLIVCIYFAYAWSDHSVNWLHDVTIIFWFDVRFDLFERLLKRCCVEFAL